MNSGTCKGCCNLVKVINDYVCIMMPEGTYLGREGEQEPKPPPECPIKQEQARR